MSLDTNIQNFATAAASQDKKILTLVNGNVADLSALTTTAKSNLVAAINELVSASASASGIDDASTSTTSSWSSSKTDAEINAAIGALVASSPATLDTLNELATALGDDPNFATTITTALANRVRFDAAQTLTSTQQAQAQANMNVVDAAKIGNTDTDFVAVFQAGLV